MKLAHLILAHANPDQLNKLIAKLAHEDADFYIHVDNKTAIEPFLFLARQPRVYFIKKRVKVLWWGYSIVQATLNSFEEILAAGQQYDYINLLSGQDYPIKSTPFIHRFLKDNPDKIFMQFLSIKEEWQEAIPRFTKYHLGNFDFRGKYTVERIINAVLPERKMPHHITLVGRSQWFTATPKSITYIVQYLKDNPKTVTYFKRSWAADESMFQTIIYNSEFRKYMVNDNLLFVDWSEKRHSPKILNMEDKQQLTDSPKLFARKFDWKSGEEILNYLDTITS